VIVVEKFFLKIPRVAGKIERFYINIVQGMMNPCFKTTNEETRRHRHLTFEHDGMVNKGGGL
jgi:hypothetical protein